MTITDLVAPEAIPALKVISKKQALQELAARASALTGQNERSVFEVLLQREKLGTTAVGYGVAIPHGKLPKLEKLFGLFARLERPIDFEAMDGQPVDLIFRCWAGGAGADHLKALARIARLLRDVDVAKLRASRDAQAIYSAGPAAGERGLFRQAVNDFPHGRSDNAILAKWQLLRSLGFFITRRTQGMTLRLTISRAILIFGLVTALGPVP